MRAPRCVQICQVGGIDTTYYWHPIGAPELCVAASGTACTQCIEGYVLAASVCTLQADLLHFTFDNHFYDLSPNRRDAIANGVPNNYSFTVGPDGSPALVLDGADDHAVVPAFTMGGTFSLCVEMRFDSFPGWSRGTVRRPDCDRRCVCVCVSVCVCLCVRAHACWLTTTLGLVPVIDFGNGAAANNVLVTQMDTRPRLQCVFVRAPLPAPTLTGRWFCRFTVPLGGWLISGLPFPTVPQIWRLTISGLRPCGPGALPASPSMATAPSAPT